MLTCSWKYDIVSKLSLISDRENTEFYQYYQ